MSKCRQPCRTCPWRVEQHADEIPNFRLDMAEKLDATTSDQFGAPIFQCHQSTGEKPVVCVGWLWRYGPDNIGIRLRLLNGQMQPEELEPNPEVELHETFQEVIEKLREDCA